MSAPLAYRSMPCDDCGAPAESIHIVPSIARRQGVRFGCAAHDPEGYWFWIRDWATGPNDWSRPGRKYTTRQHLLTVKVNGSALVAEIERRLPTWLVNAGRRT